MGKWIMAAALFSAAAAPAQAEPQGRRFIIGFKAEAAPAEREALLRALHARPLEDFAELGAVVAEVPEAAWATVAAQRAVERAASVIEEDFVVNWLAGVEGLAAAVPALERLPSPVPAFSPSQAAPRDLPPGVEGAEVPWGIARVRAPWAWGRTSGKGVKVAIVDTGIDAEHPDLKGKVAGGYNALEGDAPPHDENGHGTHVAGTVAGAWDGKGVVGVAPDASLYAVKVLGKDGSSSLSSVIKGIVWCGRNGMDVANLSLGAPMGSVFMRLAVKYAASKGVVIVAAAGNSGRAVGYPAGYPEAIAVSASDSSDKIAGFSSRGPEVEFIAPGAAVLSTVPGGGHRAFSGTSMAAPHVSGLAALAVSRGARGPDAVRAALGKAASPLAGLKPAEQGRGMIDGARLVGAAVGSGR